MTAPLPIRQPLFRIGLIASVCAGNVLHAGESPVAPPPTIAIFAEADTIVDSQVPFPYLGNRPDLAVSYSTVGGTAIARSLLRFPLDNVNPLWRVTSARIDLTKTLAAGGGVRVQAHRSEDDGWVENMTNFANQPAFDPVSLGSVDVLGFGPISGTASLPIAVRQPLNPAAGGWDLRPDLRLDDKKVTFVLKASETVSTGAANFVSREVYDPNNPFSTPPPTLVLGLRGQGVVVNGGAENGTEGWNTSGNVRTITSPRDPPNMIFQFEASSEARMWQEVDTPDTLFAVAFEAGFTTPGGTLSLMLDGAGTIWSMDAPDEVPDGGYNVVLIADPAMWGQYDRNLTFVFDGPTGAQAGCDNIEMFTVPMPSLSVQPKEDGSAVTLEFFAADGGWYRLESSGDLVDWEPASRWIQGFDLLYTEAFPVEAAERFYRLAIGLDEDTGGHVHVENSSFEEPALLDNRRNANVPGWNSTGAGAAAFNPPASRFPDEAPHGQNVADIRENNSLSQTLDASLESHRLYTVVAEVGWQIGQSWPSGSPPDLILKAGDTTLVPIDSESPMPPQGEFEEWLRDFVIPSDHPALGEPLQLVLSGGTSPFGSHVSFDDVRIYTN